MVGLKRNTTLNTAALGGFRKNYKKQKYKAHENFHFRPDGVKIVGKGDARECKECKRILPPTAFTTQALRIDGAYYLTKLCRECHTVLYKEQRDARKKAPPKPNHCECCHKKTELQVDHLHGTAIFRGWLCLHCNRGLGNFGDNLEGILQGSVYLENDKDKIIETLHKVYDEMFARTND